MIGAQVSGFAAEVVDKLLARHLPSLLAAMSAEQRAEVLAAQMEVRHSASYWRSVTTAGVGSAAVARGVAGGASAVQEVGVSEAMGLLGLAERQVRNYAKAWEPEGLARKVGGAWLLDRTAVEFFAQARSRRSA